MLTIKRSALALGTAALMSLSLTACGGASSAPKSASQDDFCNSLKGMDNIDHNASSDDQAKQANDAAAAMKKTGTPSDMPADARKGWELYVDQMAKVDGSDIDKAKSSGDEDTAPDGTKLSSDDESNLKALFAYEAKECPSDQPSVSMPTDLPTDSNGVPSVSVPTNGVPSVSVPTAVPSQ